MWDVFTAIYEWGEAKMAEATMLWRNALKLPPSPAAEETPGCLEGWAGAECDECAAGYSGEDCDVKQEL